MMPPSLVVDDLVLRALRIGDAEAWHAYLSDPLVIERTSYDELSLDDVRSLIARNIDGYAKRESLRWAITRDDVLIGTAGFRVWSPRQRSAELAYDIARVEWGRGVMTRVVATIVDWGFANMELNRIDAVARIDNIASHRVLEKCGFEREGVLRKLRVCRGVPFDFALYARVT